MTDRQPISGNRRYSPARRAAGQVIGRPRVTAILGVLLVLPMLAAAVAPETFSSFDPFADVAPPLQAPSSAHPLGSDDLGRDLLAMLVHGARGALFLALVSVTLTLLIGGAVGLLAGWAGGLADSALMRFAEFVGVLPRLLVLLLVTSLLGPSLLPVSITLGVMSWPGLSRLIRAETMAQKHREHVMAARALGCSGTRIMLRHLAPAAIAPALALIGPIGANAILTEAGLSFLGLSDPDFISWGDLIRNGQRFFHQGWWLAMFPGLAIIATCTGLALLGEALTERR